MSTQNDRALRFYHEVLGLERLHYGIWLPGEGLSYENLKRAQERYENYLIHRIPGNVRRILDVGCGTGVLAGRLLDLGYRVEGLSPDVNQEKTFRQTVNAPFHRSTFEDFNAPGAYDCIIMSESAQYIRLEKLFVNAGKLLKKDGYLMICDYFVLDGAAGLMGRSGHGYAAVKRLAGRNGFKMVDEVDITSQVVKTLDMGKEAAERILAAVIIGSEKVRAKHPGVCRLIFRLMRNQVKKQVDRLQLLNSQAFQKSKTYRFLLLQAS